MSSAARVRVAVQCAHISSIARLRQSLWHCRSGVRLTRQRIAGVNIRKRGASLGAGAAAAAHLPAAHRAAAREPAAYRAATSQQLTPGDIACRWALAEAIPAQSDAQPV